MIKYRSSQLSYLFLHELIRVFIRRIRRFLSCIPHAWGTKVLNANAGGESILDPTHAFMQRRCPIATTGNVELFWWPVLLLVLYKWLDTKAGAPGVVCIWGSLTCDVKAETSDFARAPWGKPSPAKDNTAWIRTLKKVAVRFLHGSVDTTKVFQLDKQKNIETISRTIHLIVINVAYLLRNHETS